MHQSRCEGRWSRKRYRSSETNMRIYFDNDVGFEGAVLIGWANVDSQRLRCLAGRETINELRGFTHASGYSFGRMYSAKTGKAYPGFRPSKKSIKRMVETIHALTTRSQTWQETTELVAKLNRTAAEIRNRK